MHLPRRKTVATPRVTHPTTGEAGPPEGPVLERLQYRIAQSGKNLGAVSARDPLAVSLPVHPMATLFSGQVDSLYAAEEGESSSRPQESHAEADRVVAELERRLEEEKRAALQAIAAAREQGRREESQLFEEALAAERRQWQSQILRALEEFRMERQRYFHHVEEEVVRLSLAIAGRVLHREA